MEGASVLMHVTCTLQTFSCPQTHTGGLAHSQLIHTSDCLCSWLGRSIWWHEEKHSPSRELFTRSGGDPGTEKESTEMASHQSHYTKSQGKKEARRPSAVCVGCSLEIWTDNLLPACRQPPVEHRHGHKMDRWRGEGEQLMTLPLGIKQDPDELKQSALNQLGLDHLLQRNSLLPEKKIRGLKMQTGKGDCIFPFCCQMQYNVAFIHLQLLPYPFQSSGTYPQNTGHRVGIHP